MLTYRGEKRFLAVELADVLAELDGLTGTPTVVVVRKRGREATTMVVNTPSAPAVNGTQVRFWVDVPEDQERGSYYAQVTCGTTNGETVVEEAPLLVA